MTYFSRLTDIVTCNLSEILNRESDPRAALQGMLGEMEEGLAGARRSVKTAAASVERLLREIQEQQDQTVLWTTRAKNELTQGNEQGARNALIRKAEVEDVIAGLQQQHKAAVSTRDHLTTTLRALEARIAEARRRLHQMDTGTADKAELPIAETQEEPASLDEGRRRQVEIELERLRRSLQDDKETSKLHVEQ